MASQKKIPSLFILYWVVKRTFLSINSCQLLRVVLLIVYTEYVTLFTTTTGKAT